MSGKPWNFAGESRHLWPGLSLRAARFGLLPLLRAVAVVVVLLAIFAAQVGAAQDPPDRQLAAAFQLPQLPGLPALTGPSADWRQFDAFFTFVVKRFGEDVPAGLKDSLTDAFLDSRYELTSAVAPGKGGNPVPQLFVDGWKRLSPIMNQSLPSLPKQTASLYSSFIGAADKLATAGGIGLNLTPDALKGMASIIAPSSRADPLAYSTSVDAGLRTLLGFGAPLPRRQSRLDPGFLPGERKASRLSFWYGAVAIAAEPSTSNLNQMLPDKKDLQSYLTQVRSLLIGLSDKLAAKSKLADAHKTVYRQIVFTAAWQESCWRQYIKKGTPLASATGDLGLMQVNRNTWRGVYDLKGLGADIEYNGNAGGEILLNYLTRSAIKKGEDKQPGGNLARATYSAYNGGPGAVARYRGVRQSPEWKKVDEAFWEKFQQVSAGKEMDVSQCYTK
ncbi:MAG TPA: transglycosylase SLT domain-containing protein [Terriglobales bacterium]|nr:transglycosylase SLT domain-containing protein [Terriglobales bacterium]